MIHYVLAAVCFCIIAAAPIWSAFHANKTPAVKSHDAIDEEIRRERLALHNASLDYAELQTTNRYDVVRMAAAFRMGAQWQQRQP